MNVATLAALADFPRQLALHYAAIPAPYRQWVPRSWEGIPSEHLTPIEQLCHVRDIEIDGYQQRFQRVLDEENPHLAGIDTDALVVARDYRSADGDAVIATFRAARARTIAMITSFTPEHLARTAQFEGYGPATLRSLVHYLCSHDQQHLAGLQWLLGQIDAEHARRAD